MRYAFWTHWKKITHIEKQAISAINLARKLIIKSVPAKALVAIYIKGSFVRREMKNGSDIDIVPIVTENKYEKNIFAVNCPEIYPAIVVPLSLWELKNNKLCTKNNTPRARPDRFVRKLKNFGLIYGEPLDVSNFKVRTEKEALYALIKAFRKSFIPLYEKGKIGFSELVKETFWLIESEQEALGRTVPHSFKGISEIIKDKNHIAKDAYALRLHSTKDKIVRDKFIRKLKKYLDKTEKLI